MMERGDPARRHRDMLSEHGSLFGDRKSVVGNTQKIVAGNIRYCGKGPSALQYLTFRVKW